MAKWKELSKVPKFLYDSAKATIGNTAYIVGGFEETPVDYVYSYDGDTDTWKEEPSLRYNLECHQLYPKCSFPVSRGRYSTCVVSVVDTLYVLGNNNTCFVLMNHHCLQGVK